MHTCLAPSPRVPRVLPEEPPLGARVVGQHEVALHPGGEVELEEAPERRFFGAPAAPGDAQGPAVEQHGAVGHLHHAALTDRQQLHLVAPLKLHLGGAEVLEVHHENALPVALRVPQGPNGCEVVQVDVAQLPGSSRARWGGPSFARCLTATRQFPVKLRSSREPNKPNKPLSRAVSRAVACGRSKFKNCFVGAWCA